MDLFLNSVIRVLFYSGLSQVEDFSKEYIYLSHMSTNNQSTSHYCFFRQWLQLLVQPAPKQIWGQQIGYGHAAGVDIGAMWGLKSVQCS